MKSISIAKPQTGAARQAVFCKWPLIVIALLLSGCVASPVKTEPSAVALEQESQLTSPKDNASPMMQLYIYQDDGEAKKSNKATRRGYLVEFAINKDVNAEQLPAKILYRD